MSIFYTSLEATRIGKTRDDRAVWKLTKPLRYYSDVLSKIIEAPIGFTTDFATVPRIPIAYLVAGGTAHEAAVLHDWLYYSNGVTRKQADDVLYEAGLLLGEDRWRMWAIWMAVRATGWTIWGKYRNAESKAGSEVAGAKPADGASNANRTRDLPEA